MKQLTIFVRGNYVPLVLRDEDISSAISSIEASMDSGTKLTLQQGGLDGVLLRGDQIDGFYVRDPVENVPQKMLKLLEKQDGDGEGWREKAN